MRCWETGESTDDLPVTVKGFQRAIRTDLLERDQADLPIAADRVALPIRPRGFAGLRLVP